MTDHVEGSGSCPTGLGWCPNHPVVRSVSQTTRVLPIGVVSIQPDDPPEKPGRIRKGAGIAADSFRTVFKEKSLLWFSAGAGSIVVFMFLAVYALHVFAGYPYGAGNPYMPINGPDGIVLTGGVEFVCTTILLCLLAGLISGNQEKERNFSIRAGLAFTTRSIKGILFWAGILSIIVTAIYTLQVICFPGITFAIWDLLTQFPFYFIIKPEVYNYGPIGGSYHIISALATTFSLMALTLFFIILTLYVVPVLILEKRSLKEAVKQSAIQMKENIKVTASCILVFFLILLAFTGTALHFPAIYHILRPEYLLFWYPGTEWIAAAYIWMATWIILFAIGLTAAGIAVRKLYDTSRIRNPE